MTDEQSFMAAIAAEPRDLVRQLAFADWLAERSRGAEEKAWRWIAAFRRRPCPFRLYRLDHDPYWAAAPCEPLPAGSALGGYGWICWTEEPELNWFVSWPGSAGIPTLPYQLFRWLPRGNMFDDGYRGHRPYNSRTEAYTALVTAFVAATAPRSSWLSRKLYGAAWVPRWDLAASVPDE